MLNNGFPIKIKFNQKQNIEVRTCMNQAVWHLCKEENAREQSLYNAIL